MAEAMQPDQPLPVGSEGKRSGGWWGMLALIVTEGSLFGYLLFTYFYLASQTEQHWPPEGLPELADTWREYLDIARQQCVRLGERALHSAQADALEPCVDGVSAHSWRLLRRHSA